VTQIDFEKCLRVLVEMTSSNGDEALREAHLGWISFKIKGWVPKPIELSTSTSATPAPGREIAAID
jgi:hypothetical protein